MKTSEQILVEIGSAMELNKNTKAKCNMALSDAISLIQHNEKGMQNRLDEEYKRGINDTWEIAREICKMNREEYNTIFQNASIDLTIMSFTPIQIKEKISTYRQEKESELSKIHVGDVVQHIADATKATILDVDSNTNLDMKKWMVFTENGCVESWYEDNFSKTGESVDVCSALVK